MEIPKIYQYYPSVRLSDLSDLYSVGDNRLGTQRAAIISYMPKILRVGPHEEQILINKYVLFIEDTISVDSINWSIVLYKKGVLTANLDIVFTDGDQTNAYTAYFDSNLFESDDTLQYERAVVSCTVVKGGNSLTLEIEHRFICFLDYNTITESGWLERLGAFIGLSNNPTTNYLLNCLNDYLTEPELSWNGKAILSIADLSEKENLMKMVTAILYSYVLKNSNEDDNQYNIIQLPKFENENIKAFLNNEDDSISYDGGYRNGITQLPLYLLKDLFTSVGTLPDYANINETDDKLFDIISDTTLENKTTDEDDDDNLPMNMNGKIIDSKQRIHDEKNVFIEWYCLTLFPKSCIKLTAVLLKYIFECSKKNSCSDGYKSDQDWATATFDTITEYPYFIKSLLMHYITGLSGKVNSITIKVYFIYQHMVSSYVAFIVNNPPRIVTAYFAKKVVTKRTDNTLVCFFERIDNTQTRVDQDDVPLDTQPDFDNVIGRQVYLVIETVNCRKKNLVVNLLAGADNTLAGIRNFAGNNDYIPVMTGPTWASDGAPQFDEQTNLTATVGEMTALQNQSGTVGDYINVNAGNITDTIDFTGINVTDGSVPASYNMDHADKAIIKLSIRPASRTIFDEWTDRMRGSFGSVEIVVKTEEEEQCFFGNSPILSKDAGEFLNGSDKYDDSAVFRLRNMIAFEIFHTSNSYGFLEMLSPGERKKIGKLQNTFIQDIANNTADSLSRKVIYYYFDDIDNEHCVCNTEMVKAIAKHKANAIPALAARGAALIPSQIDFIANRAAQEEIWAITLYFYTNGTYAEGNSNPNATAFNDTKWYENVGTTYSEDLIHADFLLDPYMGPNDTPTLSYEGKNLKIHYNYDNTRRRYAKPAMFAGLIAALAKMHLRDSSLTLVCQGFAYQDGSCYPSSEHVNGNAIDTNYFTNTVDTQDFINDLFAYGFRTFRIGRYMNFTHGTRDAVTSSLHEGHLHSTAFDETTNNVQIINA